MLNAGYVDIHNLTKREEYKVEGANYLSIISPVIANIYFHEFDEFIQDVLIPQYTKGISGIPVRQEDQENQFSKQKEFLNHSSSQEFSSLKKNNMCCSDEFNFLKVGGSYKRLYYVRYADDMG